MEALTQGVGGVADFAFAAEEDERVTVAEGVGFVDGAEDAASDNRVSTVCCSTSARFGLSSAAAWM